MVSCDATLPLRAGLVRTHHGPLPPADLLILSYGCLPKSKNLSIPAPLTFTQEDTGNAAAAANPVSLRLHWTCHSHPRLLWRSPLDFQKSIPHTQEHRKHTAHAMRRAQTSKCVMAGGEEPQDAGGGTWGMPRVQMPLRFASLCWLLTPGYEGEMWRAEQRTRAAAMSTEGVGQVGSRELPGSGPCISRPRGSALWRS